MQPPRIAVIGAGPSGLYAVTALLAAGLPVSVTVLDRMPAPYGLVRYGVAPDHLKMKSVIRVLQQPFADDAHVEFLGDVPVGGADGEVPIEELRRHFDAIVYATGSPVDRLLGVPGEELDGCYGSGAFVSWYCGHPDQYGLDPQLDRAGVAVVGAGNVALDVARVLVRDPDEMADTDVPDGVLAALRDSAVTDVHVLVRRGPQHVRFTPAELRQLGELAGVQVLVHDDGLLAGGVAEPAERRQRQNLAILAEWAAAPRRDAPRRVHLHFLRSPVRLLADGNGRVEGVVVERNAVDPDGRVRGTGERETLDVGLLVRAIGYAARPLPGLPFDETTGTVPNSAGRVVDADGRPVPGAYVTGWIKRGPSGVIGTNKADAAETVAALLADLPTLPAPPEPEPAALRATLARHGVRPVDWAAWLRLDAEERRRGKRRGTERVKLAERAEMLAAAHGVGSRR